jgi:hypothetical protein
MKYKRLKVKDGAIYTVKKVLDEFIMFSSSENNEEYTLGCRVVLMFILEGKIEIIE